MAKFPVFIYGVPAGVPVGNHSRRLYIPIPPAMNSLAGAIRISFGCRKSAHNVEMFGDGCAPRETIKSKRRISAPFDRS